jgi:hypothetical protein
MTGSWKDLRRYLVLSRILLSSILALPVDGLPVNLVINAHPHLDAL